MLKILSASAGAGKTFQLARIYIELLMRLKGNNRHRHILAVTFTKKATAEMKERIVEELDKLACGSESDHLTYLMGNLGKTETEIRQQAQLLLTDILQDYSTFGVSTIDSFFQIILRNFSNELGLQGQYNIELDNDAIREEAVDKFLFDLQTDSAAMDYLLEMLNERMDEDGSMNGRNTFVVKERLLEIAKLLDNESYFQHKAEIDKQLREREGFIQLIQQLKQRREAVWQQYQQIAVSVDDYTQCKDYQRTIVPRLTYTRHAFMEDKAALTGTQQKAIANRDWTLLAPKNAKASTQPAVERVLTALQTIQECLTTAHECNFFLKQLPYLIYLADISQNIEYRNHELNRLPLAETNAKILNLIRLDPESPFIYEKVGRRLHHYLIDEFQDTNTMQWESFRPLIDESLADAADANSLTDLIVGDTKQSIYRWRNANYKLMQEQVERDFEKYQSNNHTPVQRDSLDSNFRSLRHIVETNNLIFDRLAKYMENQLQRGHIGQVYEWDTLAQMVKKHCKKADEEGFVRMEFYPLIKEEEQRGRVSQMKQMLNREDLDKHIVSIIQDAHERGVKYSQIALLCRGNKEIKHLAQTLAANDIPTISEGGLLLNSCLSVRFIVALLKSALQPDNEILQLLLRDQYATLQGIQYPNEHFPLPDNLLQLPLYDQVETIIHHYKLDHQTQTLIYLQAFRDCVYQWQADKGADLFGFLEWWDKKKDTLALSLSEQEGAVQILTIHKSKGLQYEVVIVPYCAWDILPDATKPITLWAEPRGAMKELGCQLPVIPLKWGEKMKTYGYEDMYNAEEESLYLDNLNLLYVAFTRAKTELYVCVGEEKGIGKVLYEMVQANPELFDLQGDKEIMLWYEVGKKADFIGIDRLTEHKPSTTQSIIREALTEDEEYKPVQLDLKKPLEHWLYDEEEQNTIPQAALERSQLIGTLIHRVLQEVQHPKDLENVLQTLLQEGVMEKTELNAVRNGVKNCFELVTAAGKDWFGGKYKVMNEQPILTTKAKTQRPDRLLIRGNKAIVIDYKTSRHEPAFEVAEARRQQVRDYMNLLLAMGYEVEGYLLYMNLKRIEKVEL